MSFTNGCARLFGSRAGRPGGRRDACLALVGVCCLWWLMLTGAAGAEPAWGGFVETNFPFFSSALDARKLGYGLPADNLTPRGLILNLGHDCWACFDTDLLRVSAIWVGKAVTAVSMAQISYPAGGIKAIEGEYHLPEIIGTAWMANGIYPGWQAGDQFSLTDPRESGPDPKEVGRGALPPGQGRFKAVRLATGGACLEYEVAGVPVREWIEARLQDGEMIVQRRFRVERQSQPLWLILGWTPSNEVVRLKISLTVERASRRRAVELSVNSHTVPTLNDGRFLRRAPFRQFEAISLAKLQSNSLVAAHILAPQDSIEFSIAIGLSSAGLVRGWAHADTDAPAAPRWSQTLITRGTIAAPTNAYVIDNISLPLENPWGRNLRLTDLAFFKDGRAAIVTFDGDVWIVSGLRGDLTEVKWRRFASGLHEPQSLCIRDDQVFVFDRNGIWRLRDTTGTGEADVYELFSNAFTQTAETREYAQAMKLAPDGSFIIGKGGIQMSRLGKHNGSVLRVSPDGKSAEVLGWGLRSPYLGVHPKTGLITASDQQGNYVPTTPLHIIRDHQFYGFLSNLLPKQKYPAPIAEPLTWIPYPINASGGNQVWLTEAQMGPLNEGLIHFGYHRPEIFLVLLNHRLPRLQAAVVSVTRDLEFSPFDGAVNPIDGQLYLTGFKIFGTTAKLISGLARLRYTGTPSTLPREVVPMDKGVLLRFDVPLDEKKAIDRANYSAERWNYKRTAAYGSPHFKLDGSKGQEAIAPSSAYLSKDRKSVFIGIPDLKPVMQMRVGWALATKEGVEFQQNTYFTPYEMARFEPASEGFGDLTVDLAPRLAQAGPATPATAEAGQRVAELMGCAACHSADGSTVGKVGPTWKGLFGSQVACASGATVLADEAYLRESIREPAAKIVRGFDKTDTGMPSYEGVISEAQIEALVVYIKSLK